MKEKKLSNNQKPVKEKKVIVPQGNNEKIILWQDTPKIEELKTKLAELLPLAIKVVNAYNALPFKEDSTVWYDILANTNERAKVYLKGTLPDKVEISGLSVNKAKVLSMGLLEVDGMAAFSKALDEFTSAGGMNLHTYFKHAEKAVIIDPLTWQKFVDLHTIAAVSDVEKELYHQWSDFLTTINKFATFMKREHGIMLLPVPLGPIIVGLIARLNSDNQLIINKDAFAMLTKKIRNKIN